MRFFDRIRREQIVAALIVLASYVEVPRAARPFAELVRSIVLRALRSRHTLTLNRSLR